jgi:HSP20 family molecular chaperone IbpA
VRNGVKESGLRVVSVERALLVAILGMQLVIAWGLYQRKPQEAEPLNARAVVADVSEMREPEVSMYPILPSRPVSFPRRDLFDDMDALMSDAFQNMARLRSAMHIDEGWDVLSASPTMDMRDGDSDYRVSFSIPGARPSDIEVSLDGRVLTVEALAPVRGPHYTRLQRFERRVLLPGPVGGAADAHASITNGILRVHVPKGHAGDATPGSLRLF